MIDFFLDQYRCVNSYIIILELMAAGFGILSVFYSRGNNVLVYPTGMISTAIYVYLLAQWGLLGDLMVNGYFFIMSIYGWFVWTREIQPNQETPISTLNKKDLILAISLFVVSILVVFIIYWYFKKFNTEINPCLVEANQLAAIRQTMFPFIPYIDIFSTAIFFVGMWLMANRKIEHWIFWIIGNSISIPLYVLKGYPITGLQYLIFLILAILGLREWRRQHRLEL